MTERRVQRSAQRRAGRRKGRQIDFGWWSGCAVQDSGVETEVRRSRYEKK